MLSTTFTTCSNLVLGNTSYKIIGEGEPVLFLHGNWASGKWWKLLREIEGYKFIIPDMPGFGDTTLPWHEMPSINYYAVATHLLMDSLGVEVEDLSIVGHSLGAAVAMELAELSSPKRLMLLSAPPPEGISTPLSYYLYLPFLDRQTLKSSLEITSGYHDGDFLLEEAEKMSLLGRWGNNLSLSSWTAPPLDEDLVTWVVYGEEDKIVSYNDYVALRNFYNAEGIFLEGVGHSPMLTHSMTFQKLLERFLNG